MEQPIPVHMPIQASRPRVEFPVWGVIPERVGIAAGPEARLYREGLDRFDAVLRRMLRPKR